MAEDHESQDWLRLFGGRMNSLDRNRRRYINEALKDTGLLGHQFSAIMTLYHYPGISQGDLSERIGIDKTRITRSAMHLESCGYITRCRNAENRRKYNLYLTEKGEELVPRIRKATIEWAAVVTDGIPDEKIREIAELFGVMNKNAKK